MYKLQIPLRVQKKIKLLKRTNTRTILSALEEIQDNPESGKALGRKLTGYFSYRIGIYRIIYKVNQKDKVVKILDLGLRSGIYT